MKAQWLLTTLLLFPACAHEDPTSSNIAGAKKMFEAFNAHRWTDMAACYTTNASFLDPSFGKEFVVKGREETATKYAGMENMFPNIRDSIADIYASGDRVVVEFVSSGTAADGASFSLPIISVLTFSDGLISKDATYYDQ